MVLMWHHPKYYKELERIRKQMEKDNKRASKQAGLNVLPIVDCEGRCFAIVYKQTGDRATLVKFYKVKGRLLY